MRKSAFVYLWVGESLSAQFCIGQEGDFAAVAPLQGDGHESWSCNWTSLDRGNARDGRCVAICHRLGIWLPRLNAVHGGCDCGPVARSKARPTLAAHGYTNSARQLRADGLTYGRLA